VAVRKRKNSRESTVRLRSPSLPSALLRDTEQSRGVSEVEGRVESRELARAARDSAAPLCREPAAIPGAHDSSSSSPAQAGRLTLPACTGETPEEARSSERQSLSAKQAAEPLTTTKSQPRGAYIPTKNVGTYAPPELGDSSPAESSGLRMTGALGPALQLLPYQRRWVEDDSPLKIVVKARQIGYSFAASIRALLECLKRKTTWVFLSKGERQSRLLMEKVQEHVQSCGILARACESMFFEGTLIKQLEVRFANGSVIYGLPANPDTARGYSGSVTLDEFAFHADADKIYAALFPTITRGYGLEVISTPNGQQGKF